MKIQDFTNKNTTRRVEIFVGKPGGLGLVFSYHEG
jgi:hypothetical protein